MRSEETKRRRDEETKWVRGLRRGSLSLRFGLGWPASLLRVPAYVMLLAVVAVAGKATAQDPPRPSLEKPVDYMAWVNRHNARPDTPNAAVPYQQAVDEFKSDEKAEGIISAPAGSGWTEQDQQAIRDWLRTNAVCLHAFIGASGMRHCYFERTPNAPTLAESTPPIVRGLIPVSRMIAAQAKLRLNDGDWSGAVGDGAALRRTAHHYMSQPSLTEYLIGLGLARISYNIWMEVPSRAPQTAEFSLIVDAIRRFDRPIELRPIPQLQIEKLAVWDKLQREGKDADGDGKLDRVGDLELSQPIAFDDAVRRVDELFALMEAVFTADYDEAERNATRLREAVEASPLAPLIPDVERIALLQRQLLAERNAARWVLYIHAFLYEHGRWPKELREAAPDEPAVSRQDPFSSGELHYRLQDNAPLLYSVGIDGDDDGGKPAEGGRWAAQGDAIFWPE